MSTGPIKVGIIGTGIFAYRHHRAYKAVGDDKFEIVACANRSKEKALAFAREVTRRHKNSEETVYKYNIR